jgi:hypothetical protein
MELPVWVVQLPAVRFFVRPNRRFSEHKLFDENRVTVRRRDLRGFLLRLTFLSQHGGILMP